MTLSERQAINNALDVLRQVQSRAAEAKRIFGTVDPKTLWVAIDTACELLQRFRITTLHEAWCATRRSINAGPVCDCAAPSGRADEPPTVADPTNGLSGSGDPASGPTGSSSAPAEAAEPEAIEGPADRRPAYLDRYAAESAAPQEAKSDSAVDTCRPGEVQVSFVGVAPELRRGPYRWNPSKDAFLEIIVDNRNFRIDIGDISAYTPDGHAARGMHINFPCPAKVSETAINAALIELLPAPRPPAEPPSTTSAAEMTPVGTVIDAEARPSYQSPAEPPQPKAWQRALEQFCFDLAGAHDELMKAQGCADPQDYDWPEWSPQANSVRWAEQLLGRQPGSLSKRALRSVDQKLRDMAAAPAQPETR